MLDQDVQRIAGYLNRPSAIQTLTEQGKQDLKVVTALNALKEPAVIPIFDAAAFMERVGRMGRRVA
jgi:hypothetical protein